MNDTKLRVSRDFTIADIFTQFPSKSQRLSQEITNAGLHCVGCQAATWETLEAGMKGHGMDDAMIDSLVIRLNAIIDEEENRTTIALTEPAASKYLKILESEGKLGWGVRFNEKAGGCGGYEYVLDYSEKPGEDDVIYESFGIQIHVKKAMEKRLLGSVIDYIDGLQGAGFKIINPNVKSACGCGNSHGY
jgi:iron-sulfur cluster assembly protein